MAGKQEGFLMHRHEEGSLDFFKISSSWISYVAPGWARKGLIMGGCIPHQLLWNDQCLKCLWLHRVTLGKSLVIQIFQQILILLPGFTVQENETLFISCTL